jgi:hypothetical protein
MFGSTRFKLVFGTWQQIGWLTFPASLRLSDADADAGTINRGKLMGINANFTDMLWADAKNCWGFLMQYVDLNGTGGDAGFKKVSLGYPDIPAARGSKVSLLIPDPNCIFEMEGPDSYAGGVDNLLQTSGTGAIATSTPAGTELAANAGCLYIAQLGDIVIGQMMKADLTPENAAEIRVRFRTVSPYVHSSLAY